MDNIMDELQKKMNMDDKEKQKLREFFIKFSCYSDKTAKAFAEMILKEIK